MTTKEPYLMVTIEGEDVSKWVSDLRVTEDDRRVDYASFDLIDHEMVFSDAIQEGALVTIDLGYYEAGMHGIVIKGYITKLKFMFPSAGRPRLKILVYDESIKMGLEEKRILWNEDRAGKLTEVVETIVSEHGLEVGKIEADPDPAINEDDIFIQDGDTDLTFLQDLAEFYGCKCFIEYEDENAKFYFIPEDMVLRALTNPLVYNDAECNLLKFQTVSSFGYVQRYGIYYSRDPHSAEVVKTEPQDIGDPLDWEIDQGHLSLARERDETLADTVENIFQKAKPKRKEFLKELKKPRQVVGAATMTQAQIEAQNKIAKTKKHGEMGYGTAMGDFQLRAKSTVEIKGLGGRFTGEWYIQSVTHIINTKGFVSYFECTR